MSLVKEALAQPIVGNDGDAGPANLSMLDNVFNNIVEVILALGGVILFIMLLMGGVQFLTSGADPKKAESAKKNIDLGSWWARYACSGIFNFKGYRRNYWGNWYS